MSAGTKVTLALVAVLIIALVLYYGSLTPEQAPAMVVDEAPAAAPQPEPAVSQDRPAARTPVDAPAETRPVAPTGRFLGESIENALAGGDGPLRSPLGDREPVIIGPPPGEGVGKDGPKPPKLPEPPESPESPAPKADAEDEVEGDSQPQEEAEEAEEPQPAPQPAPQPLPEPPTYTEYTVKSGDTMSSIAREWFGTEAKWDLIAKANPLVDPNRLRVGQVLRLPPKDAEREEASETPTETTRYVVRSGDTLSRIARQYYGDESKWRIIHDANRDLLGDSPDNLRVGMRLVIPPAPQPAD